MRSPPPPPLTPPPPPRTLGLDPPLCVTPACCYHIFSLFVQFAERALAHHLLDPLGGPSAAYYISRARLELQKQEPDTVEEAEKSLKEALQFDHQVYESNSRASFSLSLHVCDRLDLTETNVFMSKMTTYFLDDITRTKLNSHCLIQNLFPFSPALLNMLN